MSLRETVKNINASASKAADFEARKPQIIADWQQSVTDLHDQIKNWLKDLEADGSLKIHIFKIEIREDALGLYEIDAMKIEVGRFVVQLQPTGRMIIGAHGRVDMFRQGMSAQDERIYILNFKSDTDSTWQLRLPVMQGVRPRNLQPLDQSTFEAALESLLK